MLLIPSLSTWGQVDQNIKAKIVLLNSLDTIRTDILIRGQSEYSEYMDGRSFAKGVVYLKNDTERKVSADEIRYLEFKDAFSKKRCFVNAGVIFDKLNNKPKSKSKFNYLIEENITGRLSWYTEYRTHGYDHSRIEIGIYIKNNEIIKSDAFTGLKKRLMRLMDDDPEVVRTIKKTKFSWNNVKARHQILDLIETYNAKYLQ